MNWQHLMVEVGDGVAKITLHRPEKLNVLNRALSSELHTAVQVLDGDPEVGCIVVAGSGERAFSAGGDIHEQRELSRLETPEEAARRERVLAKSRFDIWNCSKPTIGMINGLAFGGAAALAASLDIRIGCKEHASFKFLAVAHGRINSTWSLPNQVGWAVAKELLFTGRQVDALEAHRLGLLNHVTSCTELNSFTLAMAKQIAANDRTAVRLVKALLQRQPGRTVREQWEAEVSLREENRWASPEDAFGFFPKKGGRSTQ